MKKFYFALVDFLFAFYKVIFRSLTGQACQFYPSCSSYASQAFKTHHPVRAVILTVMRLLRCHPFCRGGYDPVPCPRGHH